MNVCEPGSRVDATAEIEAGGLAGLELQHDLYLALPDWRAWEAVSGRLTSAGAELQSLQISRQGEGFSARCRLKQLSSEAARGLSDRLLDDGLAQRASVEHLMLAATTAGRTT